MSAWAFTSTSSTADASTVAVLRAEWENGLWVVDDLIGKQYGTGESLADALVDWCRAVDEHLAFVDSHRCSRGLRAEAAAYRRVLGDGTTFSAPPPIPETQ